MPHGSMILTAGALICLALLDVPNPAVALDYQIANANAAIYDNLAVYFLHGGGADSGILTLDQANTKGAVKIYEKRSLQSAGNSSENLLIHAPVAISNLSPQPVFIQLGDLLEGGLQDQVAAMTMLVPPRTRHVSIDTLCVDPFRMGARDSENPRRFSSAGTLFPWRVAKLSMLVAASQPFADRQSSIRRSVNSIRFELAQRLGSPLEPPRAVHWSVGNVGSVSRHAQWQTSLPLALEDHKLAQVEQAYIDALTSNGEDSPNVIGAVFLVNGTIEGADIYGSHALFRQMWPKLLRAYATEAIALGGSKAKAPATVRDIAEFLAAAEQGHISDIGHANLVRESDSAVFAVTNGGGGKWVYRGYLPKRGAEQLAPESAPVNDRQSFQVDTRLITSPRGAEMFVLHNDALAELGSAAAHFASSTNGGNDFLHKGYLINLDILGLAVGTMAVLAGRMRRLKVVKDWRLFCRKRATL